MWTTLELKAREREGKEQFHRDGFKELFFGGRVSEVGRTLDSRLEVH
jgi:hypothetical protein